MYDNWTANGTLVLKRVFFEIRLKPSLPSLGMAGKVHFSRRGVCREKPGSATQLSCESQVFLQDASPKVIWVIVKMAAMRVQNAMTFPFMCVSKDY